MNERATKAIFGYARLDLIDYEDELEFGKWNFRELRREQTEDLVQSFLMWGLDRFSLSRAIPVVVQKEDVVDGTYRTSAEPVLELPVLKLQEAALGKKAMKPPSGQHRARAMHVWHSLQEKQLSELLQARKRLEAQDFELTDPVEIAQENKENRPKVDDLEATLAFGGQWLVILYSAGKSLATHHFECPTCHVSEGHISHRSVMTRNVDCVLQLHLLADVAPTLSQISSMNRSDFISRRMKTITFTRRRRRKGSSWHSASTLQPRVRTRASSATFLW